MSEKYPELEKSRAEVGGTFDAVGATRDHDGAPRRRMCDVSGLKLLGQIKKVLSKADVLNFLSYVHICEDLLKFTLRFTL